MTQLGEDPGRRRRAKILRRRRLWRCTYIIAHCDTCIVITGHASTAASTGVADSLESSGIPDLIVQQNFDGSPGPTHAMLGIMAADDVGLT